MSEGDKNKNLVEKDETREQSRKPYTTPQLTVHGSVEEITKGAGPSCIDCIQGGAGGVSGIIVG